MVPRKRASQLHQPLARRHPQFRSLERLACSEPAWLVSLDWFVVALTCNQISPFCLTPGEIPGFCIFRTVIGLATTAGGWRTDGYFPLSLDFRSDAICWPWNRPFSIKISLVLDPATMTPAT